MSFLDRLKREADQQRLQAEQLAVEREARETRYRSQIEPKMKALNSYLEGLAATLLEVKPPIVIRMAIQGYGDLCTVPFWDYKVEHERRHRSFAISMAWSLRVDAERTPVVRADGVTRVKALSSVFRQFHLGGIKEEKRTPQGELSCATFHARGYIKARMEATISADDPVLRLMFENASWLGASRRQVPFDQIDDNLFDRIGRFVVREDDSLFTEELSDALRQKLRKEPEPATASPATAPPAAPAAPATPAAPRQSATPPAVSEPAPMPTPKPESPPVPAPSVYENTYASGSVAALAPLMQGEMIEIDESKLGLADFSESDEPINVFSPAALSRSQTSPPVPAASVSMIPAPPPLAAGGAIAFDESKLGFSSDPEPLVIERTPAVAPVSPPAVAARPAAQTPAPITAAAAATLATPAVPTVQQPQPVARPPAAVTVQEAQPVARPPAAVTAPAVQPQAPRPPTPTAPSPPAAAAPARPVAPAPAAVPAPVVAREAPAAKPPAAAAAPPASAAAVQPQPPAAVAAQASPPIAPAAGSATTAAASSAIEPFDEAKEREAALFRLRMRAMLARLRSDEPEDGKG